MHYATRAEAVNALWGWCNSAPALVRRYHIVRTRYLNLVTWQYEPRWTFCLKR